MTVVDRELDRFLTLLRNKIRERGFTQLEVQEALSWGRSYISQLLTKQKSLRVEQVLLILNVIDVDPAEFFGELYHLACVDRGRSDDMTYPEPRPGMAPFNPSVIAEPVGPGNTLPGGFERSFQELQAMLRGLVRLLVDKRVIKVEELTAAVRAGDEDPDRRGLGLEAEE